MALVLFDMDKTLLTVSSGAEYVRWLAMQMRISPAELLETARTSLQYKRGTLDFPKAMAKLATHIRGGSAAGMTGLSTSFFNHDLVKKIAPEAVARLRKHEDDGDTVYILSASTQFVVAPVARFLRVPFVCTQLEVVDDRITGDIIGQHCYGEGKRASAEALAQQLGLPLDQAVFYTDSISDLPLMEVVGKPVAVNPDKLLRAEARRRGWPIESFY